MKRSEKPFFVENLKEELKSASLVVLVDYSGLSVKMQQELKKRLKSAGASMTVVKNTLFKRAGEGAKIDKNSLTDTVLSGPTALVLSEGGDPMSSLQILEKFAGGFGVPQFKVGIIDGAFQDKENLIKLAKLPGKDILYGQLVGSIASPAYALVATLQGNLQKLTYTLKQASKQN